MRVPELGSMKALRQARSSTRHPGGLYPLGISRIGLGLMTSFNRVAAPTRDWPPSVRAPTLRWSIVRS